MDGGRAKTKPVGRHDSVLALNYDFCAGARLTDGRSVGAFVILILLQRAGKERLSCVSPSSP